MNCLYEAVATVFLRARYQFVKPVDDDIGDAEQNLEACRFSLAGKERDLAKVCTGLAREAVQKRKQGDIEGAKARLRERRRHAERLVKLRNRYYAQNSCLLRSKHSHKIARSLTLVEKQLDALRSSELDKEVMYSLKQSTEAMKKAGIGVGLEEAEAVIAQLDNTLRESHHVGAALAAPLQVGASMMMMSGADAQLLDELDLDAELGLFDENGLELPSAPAHFNGMADSVALPSVPAVSKNAASVMTRTMAGARPRSPSPGPPQMVRADSSSLAGGTAQAAEAQATATGSRPRGASSAAETSRTQPAATAARPSARLAAAEGAETWLSDW